MKCPISLRRILAVVSCSAAVAFFVACGSDEGPTQPAGPTAVSGNVSKGPLAGATVNIHQINANGTIGALVAGPFVTDAGGNWTGQLPEGASGHFVLVATGGSYVDEATSTNVTLSPGTTWYGMLLGTYSQVTPLTHTTFLAFQEMMSDGYTLSAARALATSSFATAFGFSETTTPPSDAAGATAAQHGHAGLLGGLSELIDGNAALAAFASTPRDQLITALAQDLVDGLLDGLDAQGNAIQVPTDATGTTTLPLPALSATDLSAWLNAVNSYCASVASLSGVNFAPGTTWNPLGGSTASGQVFFSGTGAAQLQSTVFVAIMAYRLDNVTHVWIDTDDHTEIITVLNDDGSVRLVDVSYYDFSASYFWQRTIPAGIPEVTRVGGQTHFNNVTLPGLGNTTTTLTLNGSLVEPKVR